MSQRHLEIIVYNKSMYRPFACFVFVARGSSHRTYSRERVLCTYINGLMCRSCLSVSSDIHSKLHVGRAEETARMEGRDIMRPIYYARAFPGDKCRKKEDHSQVNKCKKQGFLAYTCVS